MSRPRRPEYDAPAFREMWFSPMPIAEIARRLGVKPVAISLAARRRDFPTKYEARRVDDDT